MLLKSFTILSLLSALAHTSPVPLAEPDPLLSYLLSAFTSSSSSSNRQPPTIPSSSDIPSPQTFRKQKPPTAANCSLPAGSPLLFRNELINKGSPCKPITIIYARGTTNAGNVGEDVGPCFFTALEALRPGQLAVQGVNDYPATIPDFLRGGSKTGAANINATIAFARSKCPDTSIVLSGFSQGAQIMHLAKTMVPPQNWASVKAVMLFGDPRRGQPFPKELDPKRVITNCHEGDKICDGSVIVLPPHLNYEDDAPQAADGVQKLLPPPKSWRAKAKTNGREAA